MLLDGWSVDERVGASPDHYAHHRTVKDTTGAALPGVTLVVVNQDSGLPARSDGEILAECLLSAPSEESQAMGPSQTSC